MSYALSAALQAAVFQQITGDPTVTAAVGSDVFDAVPSGQVPSLYVALGPERVRDASDKSGGGALHEFTVSVVTDAAGFATAKGVAGAVSDALIDAPLTLSRGRLIGLRFVRATAAQTSKGKIRRIDLIFRARVADDTPTP